MGPGAAQDFLRTTELVAGNPAFQRGLWNHARRAGIARWDSHFRSGGRSTVGVVWAGLFRGRQREMHVWHRIIFVNEHRPEDGALPRGPAHDHRLAIEGRQKTDLRARGRSVYLR